MASSLTGGSATGKSRARVVRFHKIGGPEVLVVEEVEVPPPGPNEVQIRIHALGLNRAESMFRSGQYLEAPKFPARLGYEAAGTVAAVGSSVRGFKIGEAVSVVPSFSLNQYGVYGELANVPVHAVVRHPSSLSMVDAAAVWMQYLTAYGALIQIAELRAGDTVLIPAASSSVGLAAIQLAKLVGAVPVAFDANTFQASSSPRRGSNRGHCDGGARSRQGSAATDQRQRCAGCFRSRRRSDRGKAHQGDGKPGNSIHLRRAQYRADAVAIVRGARQIAYNSWICVVGDLAQSRTSPACRAIRL